MNWKKNTRLFMDANEKMYLQVSQHKNSCKIDLNNHINIVFLKVFSHVTDNNNDDSGDEYSQDVIQ